MLREMTHVPAPSTHGLSDPIEGMNKVLDKPYCALLVLRRSTGPNARKNIRTCQPLVRCLPMVAP